MMAQRIILFGDQTDPPVPMIRRLVEKSRHSKNLQSFLRSTVDAVQLELIKLTPTERESVGSFQSVQELAESFSANNDRFGIAQMALVFMARIGELILHAESNPSLLDAEEGATPLVAFGICGGLLAAATAAVATNVAELIVVANYIVTVAVRVGVATSRRSLQIEDDTGSWAFSALGKIVPQLPSILDQYHRAQAIPRHRQAYIGINADVWATVFGPPALLKGILESSEALRRSDIAVLPLFGAVHAPHLAMPDIAGLMGDSPLLNRQVKPNYMLISGSKYKPVACNTLRELLQECLVDIFQCPLNPTRLFKSGGYFFEKDKEISLLVPGVSNYQPLLRRSLHAQGFQVEMVTNPPAPQNLEIRGGSGLVAIIGMAGRFPGSDSVDELWETIMRGQEFHQKIPADRFDVDAYFDKTGAKKNAITTAWGCFLEHPGLFDHKMFNVSPREAVQMDPGQRLLMHAVYEALEDAGVATNSSVATDNKRISTFVGDCMDDWREMQPPLGVDIYMVQGTQRAFTPGRINHHFKWEGATFSMDSACGSTASAVGMAYRSLLNRDCDTAIAGGSNIIATPFWQSAMSKGGFLSPTGGCKTFREDADGYCRAEAVGVMVLKRMEDALQDNDNITAVIRGYARNHSAETVSITRPHCETQERVYRSALKQAGLEPHEISYIEAHGTGTTAGDGSELESIANVFGQPDSRDYPVAVGAVKANVGHSEAASGITSLIKAALTIKKEVIPPQVGVPQKLGKFPCLERDSIVIPGNILPFSRHVLGQKRHVLVSNFDAAGGNSCFVLEEPAQPPNKEVDPRSYHVVACSAHSPTSFEQNRRRLLKHLTDNIETIDLASLAYTTTARRMHHSLRSAYCGSSIQDIIDLISKDLGRNTPKVSQQKSTRPVVFLFTGQGGHYAGMGSDLFKALPQFRATINDLQRICDTHEFASFVPLIADPDVEMGTASTVQLHLALVALEIALVDLWRNWGIQPDFVIGHSIGEYAAFYAAGVLSANDVMYLTGKRAQLIQSLCTPGSHAMVSVSGTVDQISLLLSEENLGACEVACWNSPGMVVFSGDRPEIKRLEGVVKEHRMKYKLLDIPYAMHSHQMDVILPELRRVAQGLKFNTPKVAMVSTLLGGLLTESNMLGSDYLVRHTRESVKFEQAIETCVSQQLADSTALWLEIGPNPTCLGILRSNTNIPSANALHSLKGGDDDWKTVSNVVSAAYKAHKPIRWSEYHRDFHRCLSHIDLPKYAFDTREFWLTWSTDNQRALEQPNGISQEKPPGSKFISTCLHSLVEKHEREQSAVFSSNMSDPSLLQIIEGHRLSGIPLCPAGAYSDMAMTAVRYLLTNGDLSGPFPSFSVLDIQMDHPIVPTADSQKIVHINIQKEKQPNGDFMVSFMDHTNSASTILGRCGIHIQDENTTDAKRQTLLESIGPKISKLLRAAKLGLASHIQKRIFYKLFSTLMTYSGVYEGVQQAIVNRDFTEAVATVRIPPLDETRPDQRFTLSPYWMDALAHLTGFLLNGNPNISDDSIYIAMHVGKMEMMGRDFSPDISYQCYAYTEYEKETNTYLAHVYMLHEGYIVGSMEGCRFRKMSRKTLHRVLGQADPPQTIKVGNQNKNVSGNSSQVNGYAELSSGPASSPANGMASNGTGVQTSSLISVFLEKLVEETGMSENELTPDMFFSEVGVDSLMSISIMAAVRETTGVDLSASFLLEHPTLQDAQRAIKIAERNNSNVVANGDAVTNGTKAVGLDAINGARGCNVILMQGSAGSTTQKPLFLIVDGAGSAAAYIHLPKLGEDLPVFAVESPWAQDPENFTCSFNEAADLYYAAIRAKQPHGPYLLGGWSAGGIFSYEVARRLLNEGERVLGLIIIDISGPRDYDRSLVTPPSMEIIDQIGMLIGIDRNFEEGSVPSMRLKRHMLSTVTCFSKLDPIAMKPGSHPDATFIIWATEPLLPKEINGANGTQSLNLDAWLYPSSHGFSMDGWETLVGPKLESFKVEGDHFSIMTPPQVSELGRVMRDAISKCAL
ncbi:Type I Iterative PKS [Onygenales sp. PD_10]|nr:Type I Iterative PKS [Onygenales sp. PD_10]